MKKKLAVLFLTMLAVMALSGCTYLEKFVVNKDGTFTATMSQCLTVDDYNMYAALAAEESDEEAAPVSDEEFEALLNSMGEKTETVMIDGVKHYVDTTQDITAAMQESLAAAKDNSVISATSFVIDNSAVSSDEIDNALASSGGDADTIALMKEYMKFRIEVTMPSEIVITNGTLSKDKKTVAFEYSLNDFEGQFYAYTKDAADVISLSGVNGGYTNKKSVTVKSADKVNTITVNGKKVSKKKIALDKDGKYNISVKTKNFEKSFTVVKDTVAPIISGVENGKEYSGSVTLDFSDKSSGIKSAKLNGKKVKSGKVITKAGKYKLVVTDKAGNKKTVAFTVK